MTSIRLSLLCAALLFPLVLVGCDSSGVGGGGEGDTAVLNTNTGLEEIEYTFQYTRQDISNGRVVVSASPDDDQKSLDQLMREALAVSRSDIQSAEVTKVEFRRVSPKRGQLNVGNRLKAFPYLSNTEVRLGSNGGPLIATSGTRDSNAFVEMSLGSGASDVTETLKSGSPTKAVLDLEVQDPSEVGEPFDKIQIAVSYSMKVSL